MRTFDNRPCSLGFTRAHVIAHVANKADAHSELFVGAHTGEVRRLHPEGYDPDAAADARASSVAVAARDDLKESLDRLEAAWDGLDDHLWPSTGIMMAGPRTMTEIVGHHLRNVEVHHVELDIGFTPADWDSVFVERELAQRLQTLPDRAHHADLLAWLLDRAPAPALANW